jgi:hypothetical protein
MRNLRTPLVTVLRAATLVDAVVFLTAALLNLDATIPLGFVTLSFPVPIWQAGIGEAVIGLTLLAAALTGRATLSWVAWGMSVLGIVFGLSSRQVQGPARDVHVLLVPLAVVVFGLLVGVRQQRRQRRPRQRRRNESSALGVS